MSALEIVPPAAAPAVPSDRRRSPRRRSDGRWAKRAFVACGWANLALGAIGAVVPLMPSTVFLLIALWAFAKGSPKIAAWLLAHPRFGRTLRAWHDERRIPWPAKLAAVSGMASGAAGLHLGGAGDVATAAVALMLLPVALYLVTRPS